MFFVDQELKFSIIFSIFFCNFNGFKLFYEQCNFCNYKFYVALRLMKYVTNVQNNFVIIFPTPKFRNIHFYEKF